MLLALGLVAFVTLAVALSLSVVGKETDFQGASRRQREAFYAAEAGLAEARYIVGDILGNSNQVFTTVIGQLGAPVNVAGIGDSRPNDRWYDVFENPGGAPDGNWRAYTLTGTAIDTTVTTNGRELIDPTGQPYLSFPDHAGVRYRVFLRDDWDDGDQETDTNGRVWLISVGEVQVPNGRPVRAVVQALISNRNSIPSQSIGCVGANCGPDMSANNSAEAHNVDTTVVRSL